MPDYMKMQLNISGIPKRNDNLPVVRVGKVCGNTLILRLVYPSISILQPFNTLKTSQKLIPGSGIMSLSLFSTLTR